MLVRHGETLWSVAGRHTGRTDIPLTDTGRVHAATLAHRLEVVDAALILRSPLIRAGETAELAGYADRAEIVDDLAEWDYGDYEGLTTVQIRAARPQWNLWRDGAPGGESPQDIRTRVLRVVQRLQCAPGDSIVFAHGHLLRVLAACWLELPLGLGAHLTLGAGSVSVLGWDREIPTIRLWNDVSHMNAAGLPS